MKPFGEAPKAPAPRQESFESADPKRGEKRRLRDAATSPTARYLAMAAIALSTQGCAAFKQAARKALPVITLEGGSPGQVGINLMNGMENVGVELKSVPRKPGDREWWRKGEGLYLPPPQRNAFEERLEGFVQRSMP
ncbi:MAG: hypothetical protein WA001_01240 [Patescibacteria group bacterium]